MTHSEYLALCKQLRGLAKVYYEEGLSLIPDRQYDILVKRVEAYEKENPTKICADSPSKFVGSLKEGVDTVNYIKPMLSLSNCLTKEELFAWMEKIKERIGKVVYVLEPKYDGLAASATYLNTEGEVSTIVQASTRGNGLVGENITRNFLLTPVAKSIMVGVDFEVRGEIMLSKGSLETINASMAPGETQFSNTRNAIAGLMRRKQLGGDLASHVLFFPYEIESSKHSSMDRRDKIAALQEMFSQPVTSFLCSDDPDEISRTIDAMEREMAEMDIEFDGVVVKVDSATVCEELGVRSNSPRWAVAYKFPPKIKMTVILAVRWQVGRTGEVAPVVDVAPVNLGVMVDKALIHNVDRIAAADWRVGDTVQIWRGGEVIPRLGEVDLTKRPVDSRPMEIPTHCPCCGSELEKITSAALYCPNTHGCPDQLKYTYDYIFSRKVFDVEGIADKTIDQIIKDLKVKNAAGFFDLTEQDLLKVEGIAEKSAKDLVTAFAKARKQPLDKVIQALCILDVGPATSIKIANYLINSGRTIHDFFKLTSGELISIDDVGPATVGAIQLACMDKKWLENAMELIGKLEIVYKKPVQGIYRENITGKRFCITGKFPDTRSHMTATLQLYGAIVNDNVSSKTDYLLVGENPSVGDVAKAGKHGVTMLDYVQYQSLFKN